MRIHKGDTVQIIAGKDRGKTGKILTVRKKSNRVLVEGINLYKKHSRPKRQGEKGEIVTLPRALSASNTLLYCSQCERGTRSSYRSEGDAKVRYCKKCKSAL